MPFEDDFGFGRHLQWHGLTVDQLDLAAAQQPGELVFRKGIGDRCHGGEDRARIGADHGRGRQRLGPLGAPALMVLRAAAMLEPAHQGRVAAGHLHPVDAEVETVLAPPAGASRHHQRPGDQRRGLARPAGLDRQRRKIDLAAAQHDLLTRRGADRARAHRHDRAQQRQHVQRLAPAAGRLRLLQKRERLADLAQLMRLAVHAPGDPLDGAEQVDQHRHA